MRSTFSAATAPRRRDVPREPPPLWGVARTFSISISGWPAGKGSVANASKPALRTSPARSASISAASIRADQSAAWSGTLTARAMTRSPIRPGDAQDPTACREICHTQVSQLIGRNLVDVDRHDTHSKRGGTRSQLSAAGTQTDDPQSCRVQLFRGRTVNV